MDESNNNVINNVIKHLFKQVFNTGLKLPDSCFQTVNIEPCLRFAADGQAL